MRKDNKPTDEQLKELYQAASEFKQVQPWKWLYDADIICVENPRDKTMGYCSVMGRGGEHYALGVYFGNEGIFGFYNLMENADTIPPHQVLHYQNCLMCSFEDRDLLANDDRKQIMCSISFFYTWISGSAKAQRNLFAFYAQPCKISRQFTKQNFILVYTKYLFYLLML